MTRLTNPLFAPPPVCHLELDSWGCSGGYTWVYNPRYKGKKYHLWWLYVVITRVIPICIMDNKHMIITQLIEYHQLPKKRRYQYPQVIQYLTILVLKPMVTWGSPILRNLHVVCLNIWYL